MGKSAYRNKLCECGSGKKQKKCNCKLNTIRNFFPNGTLIETEAGMLNVLGVINEENYPGYDKLDDDKRLYAPFCNLQQIERIINPINAKDILLAKQVKSVLNDMRINRVFYHRYNRSNDWNIEQQFDNMIFDDFSYILEGTHEHEIYNAIPCGITYDSDANGQCIKTKFGNIITISALLKEFLYFMNLFYYGISNNDIPSTVALSARAISIRIMLRTEALDFDIDPRGIIPKEIDEVIISDTRWEMLFVVAHEFSHSLLGHLDDHHVSNCHQNNYIIYNQSQKQEFEADLMAISLLKDKVGIDNAIMAAVSFFLSLDLYSQAKEQIFPSMSSYKTHPKSEERINNIILSHEVQSSKVKNLMELNKLLKESLMEDVSINMDKYEFYGSVYLGEWRGEKLQDRIDY